MLLAHTGAETNINGPIVVMQPTTSLELIAPGVYSGNGFMHPLNKKIDTSRDAALESLGRG